MFEKLEKILNRYEEIFHKLSDPDILSDMNAYTQLTQELSGLQEVAEKYIEYKQSKEDLDAIKADLELNKVADDMKEFYHEAIYEASEQLKKQEEELKNLLVPDDEYEGKKVIVEIRAGVGGEEACLFADDIYQLLLKYIAKNNWQADINTISENGSYGIKEVCLIISGKQVYKKLKYLNGIIRVQRVPITEANGRLHTSTASIFTYLEREATEIEIDPADIKMDVCRSSGAGGQKINKTSSCVMLTHIPTGIVVRSQVERSQLQNKENCMRMLVSKLFDYYNNSKEADFAADKDAIIGNTERSQKILTFNYPRSEVIDHRTNMSYNLDKILAGDLDKLIENMQIKETAEELSN